MKKVLLIFISSILTSCGILINNIESSDISSDLTYLSVEIIQTISKTEALAWTNDFKIVKLETDSEIYYDGKKVIGYFSLKDTYTYISNNGMNKTVPVYTRTNRIRSDGYGKKTYLDVEIIQTLSRNAALACDNDYKVVKLETTSDVYYDGKKIYGNFILVGTYNYITKKGIIKTVPVYVRTTEYKKRINKNI